MTACTSTAHPFHNHFTAAKMAHITSTATPIRYSPVLYTVNVRYHHSTIHHLLTSHFSKRSRRYDHGITNNYVIYILFNVSKTLHPILFCMPRLSIYPIRRPFLSYTTHHTQISTSHIQQATIHTTYTISITPTAPIIIFKTYNCAIHF